MTPPKSEAIHSPESLSYHVDALNEWRHKADDEISETRKAVFGVDKALDGLTARLKTIEKLIFSVIIGLGALVADEIARHLFGG